MGSWVSSLSKRKWHKLSKALRKSDECFPAHSRHTIRASCGAGSLVYEFPLFLWWWLDLIWTSISSFLLAHNQLNMRETKSLLETDTSGWYLSSFTPFIWLSLQHLSLRRTLLPVLITATVFVLERVVCICLCSTKVCSRRCQFGQSGRVEATNEIMHSNVTQIDHKCNIQIIYTWKNGALNKRRTKINAAAPFRKTQHPKYCI